MHHMYTIYVLYIISAIDLILIEGCLKCHLYNTSKQ